MPTTKRLLFVINSPQQQVNALILARKLAQVASQQGYQNSIISLDEFEVNESFDQVIVVGQRPKNLNIFSTHPLSFINIEEIKSDTDSALQTALDHFKSAQDWQNDNSLSATTAKNLLRSLRVLRVSRILLWQPKLYSKAQKSSVMRLK